MPNNVISTVKVDIDTKKIKDKVTNDKFGLQMAKEWKRLIDPFTPNRDGILEQNVTIKPFEITYNSPYSHYMYGGRVYVDPVYHFSGLTTDNGETWFSRSLAKFPDAKKIPTDRKFNFRRDKNEYATDHWDKAAEQAGQAEKLAEAMTEYLNKL